MTIPIPTPEELRETAQHHSEVFWLKEIAIQLAEFNRMIKEATKEVFGEKNEIS